MKRRRYLGALAATAGLAVAGCLGGSTDGPTADAASDGADAASDDSTLPLSVETLDAPGSTAGEATIPTDGQPTVLDLFATWCAPCEKQMESLGRLHDEFGDDVAFVSVTNERLGGGLGIDDIRQWWVDNDGDWTLGHDPESTLMRAVRAGGLPYLVVFDASGEITWTHRGLASEDNLREAIEETL
ncbi:TlpA family protein disulfide reductase [Haloferax namakaokahaiae]|uniref:TlpA family protein disulfide reductase n=1 Tax=Haloferax namakaokahaiae TaxID=1748331 RepID=A0ABD5ZFL5_9EURY